MCVTERRCNEKQHLGEVEEKMEVLQYLPDKMENQETLYKVTETSNWGLKGN